MSQYHERQQDVVKITFGEATVYATGSLTNDATVPRHKLDRVSGKKRNRFHEHLLLNLLT